MFRQYRKIEPNEFILAFGDCSTGLGDYSACQFISKTKLDMPLVYHSKKMSAEMTNDLFPVLEKLFDITGIKPIIAYERNNGGVFEMERLASLNRRGKYEIFKMPTYGRINNPQETRLGWDTNTATRPKMLSDWREAIDKKLVKIYDKPTIKEHFAFIINQTSTSVKAEAEQGSHDDLVISSAGVWQLYQMCEMPRDIRTDDFPDDTVKFEEGWY